MAGAGGKWAAPEGRSGEAEEGFGGAHSGFRGGTSQPSQGKNIGYQGRSIRIPDGVELNIVLVVTIWRRPSDKELDPVAGRECGFEIAGDELIAA